MLTSLVYVQQGNGRNVMKIVNIDKERNFRKNVSYGNIKSHKKPGLCPRLRKCSFGTGVFLPPSILRVNIFMDIMFKKKTRS